MASSGQSAGTERPPAAKRQRSRQRGQRGQRGQRSRGGGARKNPEPGVNVAPALTAPGTVEDCPSFVTDLPARVFCNNPTCELCCSATFANIIQVPAERTCTEFYTCTLPDLSSTTRPPRGTTTRPRLGTRMLPVPSTRTLPDCGTSTCHCLGTRTRSGFSPTARPTLGTSSATCVPGTHPATFARTRPVLPMEDSDVRGDLDSNGDSIVNEIQGVTSYRSQGQCRCVTVPPFPCTDWMQTATRRRRPARRSRQQAPESDTSGEPMAPCSSTTAPVHSFNTAPVHSFSTAPVHSFSIAPVHIFSTAPVHSFSTEPLHSFNTAPVHIFSTAPVHSFSTAPVHSFNTAPIHSFSTAPVHSFSTAPVPDRCRVPPASSSSRAPAPETCGAIAPVSSRSTQPSTSSDSSPKQAQVEAGASSASGFFVRRQTPPALEWSDPVNLWTVMSKKEARYQHSSSLLEYHSALRPRDRAIVLEWLMGVCEVNQFAKETFFLATDLFDRFLLNYANIALNRLQLVGTTALFIAAKAEEKTSPLAREYAELTEGACTEEEIIQCEVIVLKTLNWNVMPVTVIAWLTFYLQLIDIHQSQKKWLTVSQYDMTYPRYSKNTFLQASRLLELCILDVRSLEFKYSVLAACAVYHALSDIEGILDVIIPCVDRHQLPKCLSWMAVFADVLQEAVPLTHSPASSSDHAEVHLVQRHTVSLDMLDKAMGFSK